MKNKKLKIILFSSSLLLSSIAGVSLATGIQSAILNENLISKSQSNLQADEISDLIPSENNDQNANLSTTAGPLTFWGNTITALDWYGAKLWQLDMSKYFKGDNNQTGSNAYNTASWQRAWFNWDYNRDTNTIWVLGYYSNKQTNQQLVSIDATNGNVTNTISLGNTKGYRFVSALASGNVMAYGGAGNPYDATASLYNATTKEVETIKGDSSNSKYMPTDTGSNYKWYFFNLIPVSKGKNLVELVAFDKGSGTTGDGSAGKASYDVYMLLVDDKLNFIGGSSSAWSKPVKIANGMEGYRNTTMTPQRDYYTMLSGGVVTVVYNSIVILNVSGDNITLSTFSMSGENTNKWIKSWAFDSNENLYFKFKDDVKIYKVDSSSLKQANSGSSITPTTYLDLSSIPSEVSPYASSYSIYNVYGYTGQLMLINSKYNQLLKAINMLTSDENASTKYGLAIAITQNDNQQDKGDYKGLLNSSNSFQKSADFDISESVLASKIPSEITKNDLTMLNNAFLKEGGNYIPFTISDIDDSSGKFKVTCNLFKVPWFATSLPDNSIPKTVTKEFQTTNKISNKTSWKTLSTSSDYDFMNMLPSNISTTDVENLDPFQVSFQSQTITNSSGKQLYPKKTYSIKNHDDTNGTVTIQVKYEYVPMGVTYTDGSSGQVLSYTVENQYNTFKQSAAHAFYFVGSNSQAGSSTQTVDVTKTQELKNLLEANTLPSSFSSLINSTDNTNSGFLQFINTTSSKGYPISKMKFTVTPDDTKGQLTISAYISSQYAPDKTDHTFTVTYTNMNKASEYDFSFNKVSTIGNQNFNTILPSSIDKGNVINSLITSKGFDTNDFTISLIPDDINGTLQISVKLSSNYATEIGKSNHGFTNYEASYTYKGFMTKNDYNNRYNVTFISDKDTKLLDLKQMQAKEIADKLTGTSPTSLKIGDKTYTNLNDLVENLLVETKGALIPTDWKNNSQIKTQMYYDNTLGSASFFITIPKSLLSGADSDLNLVVNYTGFVKGNADTTNDNLSFVSDNMLKSYLVSKSIYTNEQFEALTPTEFAKWVKEDNHINELITYKTGQYVEKLTSKSYTLSVIPNDTQGTISIIINFGEMTDSKSLSEYSIQYTI